MLPPYRLRICAVRTLIHDRRPDCTTPTRERVQAAGLHLQSAAQHADVRRLYCSDAGIRRERRDLESGLGSDLKSP